MVNSNKLRTCMHNYPLRSDDARIWLIVERGKETMQICRDCQLIMHAAAVFHSSCQRFVLNFFNEAKYESSESTERTGWGLQAVCGDKHSQKSFRYNCLPLGWELHTRQGIVIIGYYVYQSATHRPCLEAWQGDSANLQGLLAHNACSIPLLLSKICSQPFLETTHFTKLKMSQANEQKELDRDFKQYMVLNTHKSPFDTTVYHLDGNYIPGKEFL